MLPYIAYMDPMGYSGTFNDFNHPIRNMRYSKI
jgi:hypothetical protein